MFPTRAHTGARPSPAGSHAANPVLAEELPRHVEHTVDAPGNPEHRGGRISVNIVPDCRTTSVAQQQDRVRQERRTTQLARFRLVKRLQGPSTPPKPSCAR